MNARSHVVHHRLPLPVKAANRLQARRERGRLPYEAADRQFGIPPARRDARPTHPAGEWADFLASLETGRLI